MEEKFINLFCETLEIEDAQVTSETIFRDLEQWDSLAYLSVIAMIDEEFDIQIEGAEFKELKTIGDLINEIEKKGKSL